MPTAFDANNDVRLIFYHPAIDSHFPDGGNNEAAAHTLEIHTGANSIKWGYALNTNKIPTYAGEVVQILSANVTAIRMTGNTLSNFQLMGIYKWFRAYMEIAGSRTHNQTPIKFQYPERGWELGLYVTQLPQVRLAVDQIAGEWSIVAEINQDDLPAIEEAIMGQYNYSMPQTIANMSNNVIVPRGIGFMSLNPFSQYLPPNTQLKSQEIDAWVGGKITATANTIGNSFESLIASWSAGDFLNFAFDVGTGQGGSVETPDQIWTKLFGSNVVGGDKSTTTTSGGTTTTSSGDLHNLSGKLSPEQVAAVMVAAGFPSDEDVLTEGVSTSYAESTWTVNATNTNSNGSIDRGLFQINSVHSQYDGNKLLTDPVYNATAAHAIWNGSGKVWGNTDGTGAPWFGHGTASYYAILDQARAAVKRYLANPSQYDGSGGGTTTAKGARAGIVQWANWGVTNEPRIFYPSGDNRADSTPNLFNLPPGTLPLTLDCSQFVSLCYKWGGAPNPNGSDWNGYTGTLISGGKQLLSGTQTKPGDYVIFGGGTGNHAAVIVQPGSNPDIVSHGSNGGPRATTVSAEQAVQQSIFTDSAVRFFTVDGL
jgi:hypothetical protein